VNGAPTPGDEPLGRMPAEWEPHESTWLSWPHNRDTWTRGIAAAEHAMVQAVAALAEAEKVRINVLDENHAMHIRRLLDDVAPSDAVIYHDIATNDAWIRDHGAIFVASAGDPGRVLALDFEYNAWGGKYPPYDLDALVASEMASALGVQRTCPGIVLEGGSIDVNGAGALLTTKQCLLNRNRNPNLSRDEIASTLKRSFGVEQIIWLGEGIEGDDTDGHVDDITRFVSTSMIVTALEAENPHDPNAKTLAANRSLLEGVSIVGAGKPEIVELPMPEPLFSGDQRLPASYANFYVANEAVLLPVYACRQDEQAVAVLRECFPRRRVVPIDCRALVEGLGALHCLTQQVPIVSDRDRARVSP
jgi:agmatine deiminase